MENFIDVLSVALISLCCIVMTLVYGFVKLIETIVFLMYMIFAMLSKQDLSEKMECWERDISNRVDKCFIDIVTSL